MVRTGKEAHSEEADRPGRAGTRPGCRVAQGPVGPRRTRPVDRGDDRGRVVGPRCCARHAGNRPGRRCGRLGRGPGVWRWPRRPGAAGLSEPVRCLMLRCCHRLVPSTKSARPTLGFGLRTAGVIARRESASRHDILSGGIGTVGVGLRYLVRYPTLPVGTWGWFGISVGPAAGVRRRLGGGTRRGYSSAGRAPALQAGGREFESR